MPELSNQVVIYTAFATFQKEPQDRPQGRAAETGQEDPQPCFSQEMHRFSECPYLIESLLERRRMVCKLSDEIAISCSVLNFISLEKRFHQVTSFAAVDSDDSSALILNVVTVPFFAALQSVGSPREVVWWKHFSKEIQLDTEQDMAISCDNLRTIRLTSKGGFQVE